MGFLQVDAKDNPADPSRLNGTLLIDLKDPGQTIDNKLTLSEMSSAGDFSKIVSAGFSDSANSNKAHIDLQIVTSFRGEARFPRISSDLTIDWSFANASAKSGSGAFGSSPTVAFNHVTLDAGQMISSFIGPVLDQINDVLKPIKPVLDILTRPLPVISELAGRDFTLLDIAQLFGYVSSDTRKFIEAASTLIKLAEAAKKLTSSGLDLGSYVVAGPGAADMRRTSLQSINPATVSGDRDQNANNRLNGEVNAFVDAAHKLPSKQPGGFRFPILERPVDALGLLMGRDVSLVTYTMPSMRVESRFHQSYWIFPPFLSAVLAGRIGVQADFSFGFDTAGLKLFSSSGNAADIFKGFYVSDTINPDGTGKDVPEVKLYGAIGAGAALGGNFGPATVELGVIGGLIATIVST